MLTLVLGWSWVANPLGPLGWAPSAGTPLLPTCHTNTRQQQRGKISGTLSC